MEFLWKMCLLEVSPGGQGVSNLDSNHWNLWNSNGIPMEFLWNSNFFQWNSNPYNGILIFHWNSNFPLEFYGIPMEF